MVGEDETAVLLTAEDGLVVDHAAGDLGGSDCGTEHGTAGSLHDLVNERRCGDRGDDLLVLTLGSILHKVLGEKSQGNIPGYEQTLVVNEDAAVGVTVVGDTDVGVGVLDELLEIGKVVLGGFGGVPGELPAGGRVECDGPDAEPLEKKRRGVTGGAVRTVEDGHKLGLSDEADVDFGNDAVHVHIASTADVPDGTDVIPGDTGDVLLVLQLHSGLVLGGGLGTVPCDDLDAVVLGRIVGSGYHDTGDHVGVAFDVILKGRRGNHTEVPDVTAHGGETGYDRHGDHVGGQAGVVRNGDSTGETRTYGLAHLEGETRVHVLVHNAPDTVCSEHLGHIICTRADMPIR